MPRPETKILRVSNSATDLHFKLCRKAVIRYANHIIFYDVSMFLKSFEAHIREAPNAELWRAEVGQSREVPKQREKYTGYNTKRSVGSPGDFVLGMRSKY
ncbi:hypothetical protein [Alteromonas sp. PRIM-21]|uniref:hypothetical protein n=1 Tax=Alteromonas sp. PRIM-21 TaxID=1454978 RepID=UPI0022B99785|nr:hypothetical protein [Alteromonas sp. PRIM-21]MCZ8531605.1 hypothetical protein [Alteromonas sp. PRIM-21]